MTNSGDSIPTYANRYLFRICVFTDNNIQLQFLEHYTNGDFLHQYYPNELAYLQSHCNCVGTRSRYNRDQTGYIQVTITDTFRWDTDNDIPQKVEWD